MTTNIQDVVEAVCEFFHVESKMIFTNDRKYPGVKYRQYFIYLAYKNTKCTYQSLGQFMNNKRIKNGTNHANLRRHNAFMSELRKNDEQVNKELTFIESMFNNLNTLIPYEIDLLEIANNNTVVIREIEIKPKTRFFYANNQIDKICDNLRESEFEEYKPVKQTNKIYLFIDRLEKIFLKVDAMELFHISNNIRKKHNVEVRITRINNMFRL